MRKVKPHGSCGPILNLTTQPISMSVPADSSRDLPAPWPARTARGPRSRALWLVLATATAAVVVALSALFATLRNPSGSGVPPSAPAPRMQLDAVPASGPGSVGLAAGRAAFERLGCERCHSLQGQGNPCLPLDGVGTRHDAAFLRD